MPDKPAETPIRYWILLQPRAYTSAPALSAAGLARRHVQGIALDETDQPIDEANIQAIRRLGIRVQGRSRWLNAVSASLTSAQCAQLNALGFVKSLQPIDSRVRVLRFADANATVLPAPVLAQIQADSLLKVGLTGRFVSVGVIDAGFFGADSSQALKALFTKGQIKALRNYVQDGRSASDLLRVFRTSEDFHGTEVMAALAGYDTVAKRQYGLATDAQFYLARSDQGNREFRGEEDNWVQAIEWLDSLGVRLVNTSLGYAKGMSNPAENYKPEEMDGHTSLISRVAQLAVEKKGMFIVVSAGNEGDDRSWRIISTPADAPGVLAVGATNSRYWNKAGYSSIGPEALPYLKPNVACFSLHGTSLTAPVITGLAACLLQARPALTNRQLTDIIQQSAHLYPYGNNYVGYGVPLASRALALLRGQRIADTAHAYTANGHTYTLPVGTVEPMVSVFRKKDATHVMRQELVKVSKGKLTVKRLPGEKQTTVDMKTTVAEIIWP